VADDLRHCLINKLHTVPSVSRGDHPPDSRFLKTKVSEEFLIHLSPGRFSIVPGKDDPCSKNLSIGYDCRLRGNGTDINTCCNHHELSNHHFSA